MQSFLELPEKAADKAKPKNRTTFTPTEKLWVNNIPTAGLYIVLVLQLVGVPVLQIVPSYPALVIIGFVLVIVGFCMSMLARRSLGTNWANAPEYQIKHRQKLVITGIYAYIRHPIYLSLGFMLVGAELYLSSYLAFIYLVVGLSVAYRQARKEEDLLLIYFKKSYKQYMLHSKMFIPFVF